MPDTPPKRTRIAKGRAAATRLVRAALRPPRGLAVSDVGPPADEWIVIELDAPQVLGQSLPAALRDVLEGIVRGESNAAIARRRRTSIRTVENQVALLLERFRARSRVELVRLALRR